MIKLRPIRVLVCGGRLTTLRRLGLVPAAVAVHLHTLLDEIRAGGLREVTIIHGGADGVDAAADRWAFDHQAAKLVFPIPKEDWERVGGIAGALRNTRMLKDGMPDVAIAMPGGHGTADMVAKLKAAKIRVMEVAM